MFTLYTQGFYYHLYNSDFSLYRKRKLTCFIYNISLMYKNIKNILNNSTYDICTRKILH